MWARGKSWCVILVALVVGTCFDNQVALAGKWNRAKGEVNSLHASAKGLIPRIRGLDPKGRTHGILEQLDKEICDLGASIHYDAQVVQIDIGRSQVHQWMQVFNESVACNPFLACDPTVMKEFKRLNDRYCALEEELERCMAKLPRCEVPRRRF